MTVWAYRSGILAADSLVTWNTHRDGYITKIRKHGPLLASVAGGNAAALRFLDWFVAGMPDGKQPDMGDRQKNGPQTAAGHIFMPDGLIVTLDPDGWTHLRTDFYAGGSGCDYAYGAMAIGASAAEAVRAAIRFDTGCGGDVTVLRH